MSRPSGGWSPCGYECLALRTDGRLAATNVSPFGRMVALRLRMSRPSGGWSPCGYECLALRADGRLAATNVSPFGRMVALRLP
ncbi:MAG: hypothetical protein IKP58_16170 [Victivallales bacterium]|nr:hypothetical protein [Victivallales bacterium]